MQRCVIISASPKIDIDFLKQSISPNDFVICADGGYNYAQKAKVQPNLIVGDFDSSPKPANCGCEVISFPQKKDDTDTLCCVKLALEKGFNEIAIFGATGGRTDHSYANLCVLNFILKNGARGSLLDKKNSVYMISGGELAINNKRNCTFSIFPFGCESCTATLVGFEYPLENGTLTADFPIGVSNVVVEDNATVKISDGTALIMFSED